MWKDNTPYTLLHSTIHSLFFKELKKFLVILKYLKISQERSVISNRRYYYGEHIVMQGLASQMLFKGGPKGREVGFGARRHRDPARYISRLHYINYICPFMSSLRPSVAVYLCCESKLIAAFLLPSLSTLGNLTISAGIHAKFWPDQLKSHWLTLFAKFG